MASPEVFDTIKGYLDTAWTETPIAFENDGFEPPDDPEPWVLIEVFGDFFEQESIGAEMQTTNLWREQGQLVAHVMVPRGTGSSLARTHARAIVDLFRGQEVGSVVFTTASIGASEPGETDGSYFRMTATLDWSRDT
ncbi:phage tail terminator-like protein [Shinella kummerowiae]|uniref:phage tail terminator-like protein n=1 Tax=Shinella kummerowiae TaxID=417745 RepID=UPI0021B599FE|nr:phage tail terminator-like protein [Shinella kummerowiae]MCT7665669.1 phage tail terminator-like protein [Shinella kummerowiae]